MGLLDGLQTAFHRRSKSSTSYSHLDVNPDAIVDPVFAGGPEDDIHVFLKELALVALEHRRMFDDLWRAEYTAKCLRGDALAWYNSLDDFTQCDWGSLQTALIDRYESGGFRGQSETVETLASAPPADMIPHLAPPPMDSPYMNLYWASRSTPEFRSPPVGSQYLNAVIPSPASVAPSLPTSPSFEQIPAAYPSRYIAHIRIIAEGVNEATWVGRKVCPWGWHGVVNDRLKALRVQRNPREDERHHLGMLNSETNLPNLALRWDDGEKRFPRAFPYSARLTGDDPIGKVKSDLKNVRASEAWNCDKDGFLTVFWKNPASASDPVVYLTIVAELGPKGWPIGVHFVHDYDAFVNSRPEDTKYRMVRAQLKLDLLST